MGYIDWTLLASHGGESVEHFVATLLRRKYSDALQVNPSQGDKGIDVYRETDGGLVVWQVKKFTTPLVPSQWRQVEKSWRRFWRAKVEAGEKIASYTLVTPWTPTEERRLKFAELTTAATFSTQWDGDSFIAGLTDEFPDTLARFKNGPNALEQFITQKSLLAASPVEKGESVSMMEAISLRQASLSDLSELVSDNYHIDTGTITVADAEVPLFPPMTDMAVMSRYTYLGKNRFSYESAVPRTAQSLELEPIRIQWEFNIEPDTPESQAVADWREWGIPFTDIPANSTQTGGPFGDHANDEVLLSYVQTVPLKPSPNMQFKIFGKEGGEKKSIPLRTTEVNQGVTTGWLRVLAESPHGVLGLEIRLDSKSPQITFRLDKVRGKTPEGVLSEIAIFETLAESNEIVLAIDGAGDVVRGTGYKISEAMTFMGRVADGLRRLQPSANDTFVMPDDGVTLSQIRELEALADLYEGNALTETWSGLSFIARADNSELEQLVESDYMMVEVITPTMTLGDYQYVIDRPMARLRKPLRFEHVPEGGFIEGETYRIIPRHDNSLVTAAVSDWTRGDPPFDHAAIEPAEDLH